MAAKALDGPLDIIGGSEQARIKLNVLLAKQLSEFIQHRLNPPRHTQGVGSILTNDHHHDGRLTGYRSGPNEWARCVSHCCHIA